VQINEIEKSKRVREVIKNTMTADDAEISDSVIIADDAEVSDSVNIADDAEISYSINIAEQSDLHDKPDTYIETADGVSNKLTSINPDYKCWIKIEGTIVDYPVVRAGDNEKYLNLTFFGEKNKYGTLFMDYRCDLEKSPHIIIYGHNTKNGEFFGSLNKYLDKKYKDAHTTVTLIMNEKVVNYEIFAVRKSTIKDQAYRLDFKTPGSFGEFAERCGAPEDTAQILTLSTCVSGNDNNERILIQGALK
jgi:sortase B